MNGEHIVSGGKTVWKIVVWSEGDDTDQTRGTRLNGKAQLTNQFRSSGPQRRERARKSALTGQRTYAAPRDLIVLLLRNQDDRLG